MTGCFKSKDKKAPGKSGHRFYKSIGLGFKTPKEAMEGAWAAAHCMLAAAGSCQELQGSSEAPAACSHADVGGSGGRRATGQQGRSGQLQAKHWLDLVDNDVQAPLAA